jgi:hypothetical protein
MIMSPVEGVLDRKPIWASSRPAEIMKQSSTGFTRDRPEARAEKNAAVKNPSGIKEYTFF